MIRDLETEILRIIDSASREYMREAVQCYSAGAYRAAVVIAFGAAMDSLRCKVSELAESGGASVGLRALNLAVTTTFNDQKPFEKDLVDGCKKLDILSPSEHAKIETLLKTRHLCAHPSGHPGSPEEARDVITTFIDLILARPAQMGISAVNSLLERLKTPTFFPSNDPVLVTKIVTEEVNRIFPKAYAAMCQRLVEKLDDGGISGVERENCRTILGQLPTMNADLRKLVWKYVEVLTESLTNYHEAIAFYVRDPEGLKEAGSLHRMRAIGLIKVNMKDGNSMLALNGWIKLGILETGEQEDILAFMRAKIGQNTAAEVATTMVATEWSPLGKLCFGELVTRSGSTTFDTANGAINVVQSFGEATTRKLDDEDCYQYVTAVARAADWGSNKAGRVCNSGLGKQVHLVDGFMRYITNNWTSVETMPRRGWERLLNLLENSGRNDAVLLTVTKLEGFAALEVGMGTAGIVEMLSGAEQSKAVFDKSKVTALRKEIFQKAIG